MRENRRAPRSSRFWIIARALSYVLNVKLVRYDLGFTPICPDSGSIPWIGHFFGEHRRIIVVLDVVRGPEIRSLVRDVFERGWATTGLAENTDRTVLSVSYTSSAAPRKKKSDRTRSR